MLKSNIKIKLVKNKKDLDKVFKIREIVFVKEQNVPLNRDRDEFDDVAKHVLVLYNNKPVGCARIRFINKKAKLERIAILKKYRGKGFGKKILDYLIKYCKKKNIKNIMMDAQYYLRDYYKKLGFNPRGKIFMDAGIKHIRMHLK